MALITFPNAWPEPPDVDGDGTPVVYTASQLSFQYPDGVIENYFGAFTYPGGTVLGVLKGFEFSYQGKVFFSVQGLNLPASTIYSTSSTWMSDILAGADSAQGSLGDDFIATFGGADTVIAMDGNDLVIGGAGNDDLNGNVGEDLVDGEDGADWVRGGKGADTIYGGAGNDPHVNGNLGNDQVYGDGGNDTIFGGQGDDSLSGDDGDDLISGDLGDDLMAGGPGADRFVLKRGDAANGVVDFNPEEGDRVQLTVGTTYSWSTAKGDLIIDIGGGDRMYLFGIEPTNVANWIVFA